MRIHTLGLPALITAGALALSLLGGASAHVTERVKREHLQTPCISSAETSLCRYHEPLHGHGTEGVTVYHVFREDDGSPYIYNSGDFRVKTPLVDFPDNVNQVSETDVNDYIR